MEICFQTGSSSRICLLPLSSSLSPASPMLQDKTRCIYPASLLGHSLTGCLTCVVQVAKEGFPSCAAAGSTPPPKSLCRQKYRRHAALCYAGAVHRSWSKHSLPCSDTQGVRFGGHPKQRGGGWWRHSKQKDQSFSTVAVEKSIRSMRREDLAERRFWNH